MEECMTRKPGVVMAGMFIIAGSVVTWAGTQANGSKPLAFEVASIKVNTSGEGRIGIQPSPGGRLTVLNATLRMLIRFAYNMQDNQMSGGPAWLDNDHYDLAAKAEGDAT